MKVSFYLVSAIDKLKVGKNLPNFAFVTNIRSSRREVFCKKCVLRNSAKFTGKHLYQSLPEACNFIKKESVFPVNFARPDIFIVNMWWLSLYHSYVMTTTLWKLHLRNLRTTHLIFSQGPALKMRQNLMNWRKIYKQKAKADNSNRRTGQQKLWSICNMW